MCSPVRFLFQKQWLLWQLTMKLIIHAISLLLPQAPSIVKLGKVCGWRNNEWTRRLGAIYCLLHWRSELTGCGVKGSYAAENLSSGAEASLPEQLSGETYGEEDSWPPASLCCLLHAEDALTHADWAVYDPLAREMERERVCWLLRFGNTNAMTRASTCKNVDRVLAHQTARVWINLWACDSRLWNRNGSFPNHLHIS